MRRLFEKVRSLYGYATAYNANDKVPAHIQKLRAQNLKEFDRMIEQVRLDALKEGQEEGWDHAIEHVSQLEADVGFIEHYKRHNPYRKQEEA